jgi:uncharacterized protein YkwD
MQRFRRKPVRVLIAAAVLGISATACFGPAPAPGASCSGPPGPPDAVTAAAFDGANADRSANGVAPVQWNPQLWCLASDWSNHMASTGTMTHQDLRSILNSPEYTGYNALGENIIHGPGTITGQQMETAWMASPEHRANLLSPGFTSVGVATARASDGTMYATEDFGG